MRLSKRNRLPRTGESTRRGSKNRGALCHQSSTKVDALSINFDRGQSCRYRRESGAKMKPWWPADEIKKHARRNARPGKRIKGKAKQEGEKEKLQFQWLRGATWLRDARIDARITRPPFVEALLRSRVTTLWRYHCTVRPVYGLLCRASKNRVRGVEARTTRTITANVKGWVMRCK